MNKFTTLSMTFLLLLLLGCNDTGNNNSEKSTRFLLNTVVTLDIECDKDTLAEAFSLCEKYEKLLSKTVDGSDVSKLNSSSGFVKVSKDTEKIVKRAVYYGDISGGKFDITLFPVINLWDFEGTALPDKKEISEALKNVDYNSIKFSGDRIALDGKQIDLGGIAKGYIADEILKFLNKKGAKSGIINLGGNIIVFGSKTFDVGIKTPFSENDISATLRLKNKSVVTSGVYERYIKKGNKVYHHILDPKTGYAVDTDLYSATIIGDTSLDCDALATVCILEGMQKAAEIIETIKGTEAVFIDKDLKVTYTSGLISKDGVLMINNKNNQSEGK